MSAKAKTETTSKIDLGNEITIDKVEKLTKKFLQNTAKAKSIKLIAKQVDDIDLPGIQFLIFMQKYAESKKIELSKEINYSENALDLITSTGFSTLI